MKYVRYGNSDWHDGVRHYEVSVRPRPALVELVNAIVGDHLALLEALEMQPPQVYFVRNLDSNHLARYVDGTSSDVPVIVLDARRILLTSKKYDVPLQTAFESTLLHEYGHAWLDATRHGLYDKPWDMEEEEVVVEAFAHRYWRSADIEGSIDILKELLPSDP